METNQQTPEDDHGLMAIVGQYWLSYGGWPAFWRSPFFWLSVGLLLLTSHFWVSEKWWEQVISVMPSMLGFTLGGFAVFLGFGDEKFKAIISGQEPEDGGKPSPYMEVSATFFHFVIVQLAALLLAIVASSLNFTLDIQCEAIAKALTVFRFIGGMVGYWVYLYGLCITAAAALAIFRVAFWYDTYQTRNRDDQ